MLAGTTEPAPCPIWLAVGLDAVRAVIASAMLGDDPIPRRFGDITLHPHQCSALVRLRQTISQFGGALLFDDVGLGKTYVALAVAAAQDSVAIVAPASLAEMWNVALNKTGLDAEFISMESLGRGGAPQRRRTFIIVDEAHHFRNPCTRRYSALARMCMLTPVALLTATPLHNSRDDVSAIAALFMGSRAYAMTDAELAPLIVRRDVINGIGIQSVPVVEHAPPRVIITQEAVLDQIFAIPAPVPPRDGSIASRLVIHGLVRQWVSSNAALTGALKRRIARSHGLLASLDAGRYPTAAELSAWVYTGDAVQLAFAELLLPSATPLASLASALREHVTALVALLKAARDLNDAHMADFIREISNCHPAERIVVFSCYAETAEALYRSLRKDGHVALLTARGATIASGPVNRTEILAQFDPASPAARDVTDHDAVRLLIATDLLSEGVNLQRASVVVHLDLPWTAARMEQRIGRLARLGSPHSRVVSYSVAPPPRAERFLHELEIIARKSSITDQFLGAPASLKAAERSGSRPIAERENIRQLLESWRSDMTNIDRSDARPLVAYATARNRGAIGAWLVDGAAVLLAADDAGLMTDNSLDVARAARIANVSANVAGRTDPTMLSSTLRAATAWYERHRAWSAIVGSDTPQSAVDGRDARRSLARVADATSASTGFARRFESAAVATRLRNAAASPLPLAVEWSLESLSDAADDAAVNTILDLVESARPALDRAHEIGLRCIAVILFMPETIQSD